MNRKKYQLLLQTAWILIVWYTLNTLFYFTWNSDISLFWSKLGFVDSYMTDCFLAAIVILMVLSTGIQPFFWVEAERTRIKTSTLKNAVILCSVTILVFFIFLLIKLQPSKAFFLETIRNCYTYTQVFYYLLISFSLVLFCCGLAFRAFTEETKLNFVVCCLIISSLVSPFFLIHTHSIEIFILQFLLQFTTLIVFCFYPSIWLAVSYETVMMYISFIFK
jgi:hypothetical protein